MPNQDANQFFDNLLAREGISSSREDKIQAIEDARVAKNHALDEIARRKEIEIAGPLASFGVGANRLLETAGTLTGLATGDMDNFAREQGHSGAEYFEDRKPLDLRMQEANRSRAIATQDGEFGKFTTAIAETVTSPGLLTNLLAEQIPNFIPGGVVGRGAGIAAKALGAGNVAGKVATGAAVGTGALQQGADVAGGTYDELMALPDMVWDNHSEYQKLRQVFGDTEAKEAISRDQAGKALAGASAASMVSQFLPGGKSIEKLLAGGTKAAGSVVKGAVKGALGEAGQEAIEEGSGVLIGNKSKQAVDPDQELTTGLGEAAGLGAVGGGVMGGPAGAAGGVVKHRLKKADPENTPESSALVEDAMNTGDVSGLVDPKNEKTYNPTKAAAVLGIRTINSELSEAEVADANKQLVELDKAQEVRVAAALEERNAATDPKERKVLTKKLDSEQTHLANIKALTDDSVSKVGPKPEEIDTLVSQAEATEASPEREEAATQVMALLMRDPNAIDPERVAEMAEKPGFNPEQKEVLLKYSAAHAARNALKDGNSTNKDILFGGDGFKGLAEYNRDAAAAVRSEDKTVAEAQLATLTGFQTSHTNKLAAMNTAIAQMEATDKPAFILPHPTEENQWTVVDEKPWPNVTVQHQMGGFEVGTRPGQRSAAPKQAAYIKAEVAAITATHDSIAAQFSLAFDGDIALNSPARGELRSDEQTTDENNPPPATEEDYTGDIDEQSNDGETAPKPNNGATEKPKSLEEQAADLELKRDAIGISADETATLNALQARRIKDLEGADETFGLDEDDAKVLADLKAEYAKEPSEVTSPEPVSETTPVSDIKQGSPAVIEYLGNAKGEAEDYAKNGESASSRKEQAKLAEYLGDYIRILESGVNPEAAAVKLRALYKDEVLNTHAFNVEDAIYEIEEMLEQVEENTTEAPEAATGKAVRLETGEGTHEVFDATTGERVGLILVGFGDLKGPDGSSTPYISLGPDLKKGYGQVTYLTISAANPTREIHSGAELSAEAGAMWDRLVESGKAEKWDLGYRIPAKNAADTTVDDLNPPPATEEDYEGDFSEEQFDDQDGGVEADLPAVETNEDDVDLESGHLDLLADTAKQITGNIPAADYKLTNLISAKFKQNVRGPKTGTPNPLVKYKDFLSKLITSAGINTKLLGKVFSGELDVEGKQGRYLQLMQERVAHFNMIVRANIEDTKKTKTSKEYRHRDYVQFFADDLPENIVTAISISAFTWLAENAGGTGQSYDADILAILGKDANAGDIVIQEEWQLLRYAGTRQNLVIQELGKKAAQAAVLRSDESSDQAKLELSLGTHALAMLIQTGMVEREDISDPLLEREGAMKGKNGKPVGQPFIRVVRNAARIPHSAAGEIVLASKGTKGIINKIFSVEPGLVAPSEKPGQFKQVTTKGTLRAIPKMLAKIAETASNRKWRIREDMANVRAALNDDILGQIAGKVDLKTRHTMGRLLESIEARNDDIQLGIDRFAEFEESHDKPWFYFIPKIWSQQRAGLTANLVNPQTNKYQRHNVSLAAWRTEIDTSIASAELTRFKLAVAQNMDIDVDKQLDVDSLLQLEELMDKPEMKAAIQALQNIEQGNIAAQPSNFAGQELVERDGQVTTTTTEKLFINEQRDIAKAVEMGKGKFASLDALVNYAAYLKANKTGATFTTDIMFEVDGVTNGPALTHMLLGHGRKFAKQFGMYKAADGISGFTKWRSQVGTQDLYETVAGHINAAVGSQENNPVMHFIGDLDKAGRNLVKQPLTSIIFGAGIDKALENMGKAFIWGSPNTKGIYEKIEDYANDADIDGVKLSFEKLNDMLPSREQLAIPNTFDAAMNLKLTVSQENYIRGAFHSTIGEPMGDALNIEFSDLLATRQVLNDTAKAIWLRYDTAFQSLYQTRMQEKLGADEIDFQWTKNPLVKAGPTKKNAKGETQWRNPLEELAREDLDAIHEELRPLAPVVHTAMSKVDGDLNAGLDMFKILREMAEENNRARNAEVHIGSPVKRFYDGEVNEINMISPRGMSEKQTDPGVRTVIMLVHALDSAIAASSYGDIAALNVHDALGLGMKDTIAGAKTLNKNTFKFLSQYSLPLEMLDSLDRSFAAEADLFAAHPNLKGAFSKLIIKKATKKSPAVLIDAEWRNSVSTDAINTEHSKLTQLAELDIIDQYALEGGAHQVTKKEKALIERKLAELESRGEALTTPPQPVVEEAPAPVTPATEVLSPWGTTGSTQHENIPELVEYLESAKPDMAGMLNVVDDYLKGLIGKAKNKKTKDGLQFHRQLLARLKKTGRTDIALRYIRKNTLITQNDRPQLDEFKTALGWYNPADNNGKGRISIKSDAFIASRITPEILLHESLHAVTQSTINKYLGQPKPKAKGELAAWESVQELGQILEVAREFVEARPELQGKFANALDNVHELVSWGMTNREFQVEVLHKFSLPGKGSKISNGLRAFIDSLTKLFFGDSINYAARNGMGLVIHNTSILMDRATKDGAIAQRKASAGKALLQASPNPANFTSDQVFAALGQNGRAVTDPVFKNHLRDTLGRVVSAVYQNSTAIRQDALSKAPLTADEVYLTALAEQKAPFASKLLQLNMTDQESFVAESVEITVRETLKLSTTVERELRDLWAVAKKHVKPADLPPGAYDLLFTITAKGQRSDYLSQFAAASLAYKPLHDKLSEIQTDVDFESYDDKSIAERITLFLGRAMSRLSRLITRTHQGQKVTVAIETLAHSLGRIERSNQLLSSALLDRPAEVLSGVATKANKKVRDVIDKAAQSDFIRKSKSKTVQGLGAITATIAGERVEQFFNVVQEIRDESVKARPGVVFHMINEFQGENDGNAWQHKLLAFANKHEQDRKRMMSDTSKFIRDSFGRDLTKAEWKAMTPIMLRGDLQSLMAHYSLAQIEGLLSSRADLNAAITKFEKQVVSPHRLEYLRSAKDLGYHLATGENKSPNLMFNAHNIAHLANTDRQINDGSATDMQKIIDPLVSLYALRHSDKNNRDTVSALMREQAARDGGNGVDVVLNVHRQFQETALTDLFDGSPIHMMKGYTKETFNPHIEMLAATASEGAQLVQAGYVKVTTQDLPKDPTDPTGEARELYVVKGRGLSPTITGAISNTGRTHSGYAVHGKILNVTEEQVHRKNQQLNAKVAADKKAAIDAAATTSESYDPSTVTSVNLMAPVLNKSGQAVNYRYLMTDATKDNLLQRDNRLDKVMGHMAGHALDKVKTPEINEMGVDAIKNDYDQKYINNPNAFIEFGPDSKDRVIRERYQMLPEEAKIYIKKVWGRNGMKIQNTAYDIMFGYRKASLGDMFNENAQDEMGEVAKFMTNTLKYALEHIPVGWDAVANKPRLLGKKAALKIVQAENIWQEIVKVVKDILVIKNLFTFLGNEMSNVTVLRMAGVSFTDIIKSKIVAYPATLAYQRDRREKHDLQLQLDSDILVSGSPQYNDAQQRILELNDALDRNPMKEMIDAGMFQTLVEDIGVDEDPYSYKTKLTDFVDSHTGAESNNRIVKGLRTGAKTLLMTHDSGLYKVMNQATILSDFTSRYALHQSQISRKKNPLSHEESMRRARAFFVNYDIPTHKGIQYLNDMGLLWFTKYYIRIQAVIVTLVRENPASALILLGLNDFIGNFSDILDSSMIRKPPGNLGMGAPELIFAVDEIITLKTLGL